MVHMYFIVLDHRMFVSAFSNSQILYDLHIFKHGNAATPQTLQITKRVWPPASTGAAPERVADLESLRAVAVLDLLPHHVERLLDQLRALGVVALGRRPTVRSHDVKRRNAALWPSCSRPPMRRTRSCLKSICERCPTDVVIFLSLFKIS